MNGLECHIWDFMSTCGWHGSATSSGIVIYRYDGHQYKVTDCFSKEYLVEVDEKGEERVGEKPVVKRTCRK